MEIPMLLAKAVRKGRTKEEAYEITEWLAGYSLDKFKQEGKTNTVTYKQLMAEKLKNQNIISLYKIYGLIED